MANKLNAGEQFPQLTLEIADGDALTLPEAIPTPWAVVLFYRGHW